MTFSVGFKTKFASEFTRFPKDQQNKILGFAQTFQTHGLGDLTRYEGKVAQSWSGNSTKAAYDFALANDLWHYHIGIPTYTAVHPAYKTSDWVLHFQWINGGRHIDLLDVYSHYTRDGSFYLPTADYLA
ncbi:MAG TPA: hypothetical protein VGD30_03070 [Telluria sp.]